MDEQKQNHLEKSLERVNGWLQFAEAKNAALIAFLIAILAIIFSSDLFDNIVVITILTTLYVIALIISIFSFYPKGNMDANITNEEYDPKDNLLYWKHIAKYSIDDYLEKFYGDFELSYQKPFKLNERLYAEEIITNARIAKRKYKMFESAVIIVALTTIVIPVFLIIIA